MIIRKMTASYGKLQDSTLWLDPGLNIVAAPNESGKSTWCSFIKNMLYGVDSAAREKGGVKPDKTLYAPWSGAPMNGSMDIEYGDKLITLTRTGIASAPMRDCTAVYTGTSQPVPNLPNAAGEMLCGIPREVFERTAFIGQGAVTVSAGPELEKRIAAIVQTGDEGASCTDAEERLRAAMRRRRHNKSGALPEMEKQLDALRDRLREIENEKNRNEELKLAIKQAIEKRDALTKQVAEGREKQRKSALNELGNSRERIHSLENELERLRAEVTGVENEMRSGFFYMQKPENARSRAARDIERMTGLKAEAEVQYLFRTRMIFATALFAILCAASAFVNIYAAITAAVLTLAGVAGLLIIRKKLKRLDGQIEEVFAPYGSTGTSALLTAVSHHEELWKRREELSSLLNSAQTQLEAERKEQKSREADILRGLDFSGGDEGDPTRRLEEAEAALRRLREEQAASFGRLDAMGGHEKLLGKIDELTKAHQKLTREYEALLLAADTLRLAGTEIQNRMTPRLSARASEIFARLTEGRYEALALDRKLTAMARLSGDTLPRESAFLSAGALDQLYLAVRLALCELALPDNDEKACPIILDDALGSFDDARCAAALIFLNEISRTRQVILFTCHGREAEMMRQHADVNILTI